MARKTRTDERLALELKAARAELTRQRRVLRRARAVIEKAADFVRGVRDNYGSESADNGIHEVLVDWTAQDEVLAELKKMSQALSSMKRHKVK